MKLRLICILSFMFALIYGVAFSGELTSVSALPGKNQAGEYNIYTFTFTTSTTGNGTNVGIPTDGRIVITFPTGFDVFGVEIASSTSGTILNGGLTASGADNIITVQRDSTGSPVAGNTAVEIKVGVIGNQTVAASNYSVAIQTQLKNATVIDSGTSATFSIIHNALASFQFVPIATQTVGNSFGITITAKDRYNNNVASFSSAASLSDFTGTLTPATTTSFINGVWSGSVQITKAHAANTLTATAQDKAGTSNTFIITPGALHHFTFETISSPKTAGTPFNIVIKAEDSYGNLVTGFTGAATLSDNTGTISPTTTTAFSSGQWSGNISITKKQKDVHITAISSSISSQSNQFNVQAGTVSHFVVGNISAQTAGVPFLIEVTAKDLYNNQVDQFEETVNLSDLTGTIAPAVSDSFSAGYWAGNVTVTQVRTNNIITVQRTANGTQTGTSNGFNVSHNSLDHFAFNSIPTTQTAGAAFGITITAKDAYENNVTNFTGTASLSDLSGTVSPVITGTFSTGQWSGTVTITRSWTANRIAATSGNKTGTSNSFNVNPHNLDHFRFQSITSPQIAGQSFAVTITAEDIYNNRVTSFSNTVTLSDETGTIFPTTSGNFSSGQWSGNVNITRSQNDITITATRSTTTGRSNTFNMEPNSLDHFAIGTIGTKAAGVPFAMTVTAQDFHNNRVINFTGTVTIQDLTGTISPTTSGAFDLGQWTGDVTITQVRTADRITVTNSSGTQTGNSNNFDVVAGNIDHFEIAAITSPRTAGTAFTIQITAKDANNATVTGYTGNVNLSDLSGTITPTVTPNFSNGIWSGSVTITKSFTNNQITASGAGKSGTSNMFNVQANAVTHFSFSTITSPKTAGQGFSVTIAARDNYENIATSFAGNVTLTDNTGTITPTTTPNFTSGQWTGNVTITKAQNDVEITATQGSSTGKSNKFNVEAAALHHFTIGNLSTQQSNIPFAISVIAKDQYENTATQFTGKVTISDRSNTITPTLSDNFNGGQWSSNVTITQSYSGNVITVIRQGGTETGSSNSFNVTSSNVDHFVITSIGTQVAGQSFTITIRAEDAANNLVTSFTGTATIADLTSSITPKTTTSFTAGQWSGSMTITKSRAANTISVTSGGKAGTSNAFDVNPAALDHFRVATISSPQIAGQAIPLIIYAEDVYDNRVTTYANPVNLSDNTGTITPTSSGNFSSGQWSGNATITKSVTDNILYVNGSGKSGQSNGFNVIAASLHHFVLETITTQSAGQPFAITITAQDNYSNTATQFTGKVNISDKTNTISPNASGNFIGGRWSGNVAISQAYSNDVITVINQGGSESGSSNSFDVISSNVDHFVITSIANQIAGTPFTITIRAEDSNNNLVTNFTGNASLADLTGTIIPKTTSNFSGGTWSGTVTITKSRTGDTITVTSSGKAGTSNSFNVNPATLDHFRISSIGSPQIAGQSFSMTITAEDVYDNKVTSFVSSVSLTENTGAIAPTATTNFSNGEWSGAITITKSVTDNIITASGAGKTGQSNKFNVIAANLHHFAVANITTQAANSPFTLNVTAQDIYNNTATQFTGKVNISDKTNTISPTASGNFASGKWSGNVVITQAYAADAITVVNQAGTESGASNNFDVISSNVDHFVFTTIANQVAGSSFNIIIRAEDASNNLVTSFTGTASLSDLTGTLTPTTTGNFIGGQWSGNVTITKSRTSNTITVTSSGKAGTSNAFNVTPAALDHFTFAPITSPKVAGTAFEITIYARDVYENQVTSFTTFATLSDVTTTIAPTQTGNFTSGQWSGNVTITKSQSDVKITATQSGKTGQSNLFNINPGALASFQIANISTQAAGMPFQIDVTALDAYSNVASQFTGTVNISDLTNTINPAISNNFVDGKWKGNVTITQVRQNDRITVTNTGGAQTGQSNLFNVIASSVDHFSIAAITSPKTAGIAFQITITAQDKDNNTVTGFTGTASLSDLSGTISPTTTTNFINGVWQANVTITKSWTNNSITVASSGKAGQSNTFNVTHNALDHFEFTTITSPKVAGVFFQINIRAKDIYANTVASYASPVSLTDNTGTITPTVTTNFSSGEWTGNVRITRKQDDVYIVANGSGKQGQSNFFNVKAGNLSYLKIRDTAGGTGLEVGAVNMALDDKLTLYSAGYDSYNNYIRDVIANWSVIGNLDPPSPVKGSSTLFDPKTPGTTGKIKADTTGATPDSTGLITVGSIAYVKIRTAPGGAGLELGDVTITADQNLAMYCAAYDAGKNYIGNVSVQWRTIGTLMPAINDTGKIINFLPAKAPASGKIIADHLTALDDSTGVITVVPGAPVGDIILTANPAVIPANSTSTSIITSGVIRDADANVIAKNTQFTVRTSLGTITTTDVNPLIQGIQVAANDSGKIQFTLQSSTAGGTAFISVSSVNGSATGNLSVTISNLNLLTVTSTKTSVSQGQTNIPVSMVVQNLGSSTITNISAGLIFRGPAPLLENRNSDFPNIVRTDGVTTIPGGSTRTLTFTSSVRSTAKTDTVTVDGWISGEIGSVTVNDTFAVAKWKWAVQTPPQLRITKVASLLTEVSQGRTGVNVTMDVSNQGQASATVTLDTLSFWSVNAAKDVTGEYQIIPDPGNPPLILGGGSVHKFNFSVNISLAATLGQVLINGRINGTDANSGTAVSDNAADTTHTWTVKNAPIVGIKGFYPSQLQVTKNQTMPWTMTMIMQNNGGTAVRLDSASAAFFLGGGNVTSQYTVIKPIIFSKSKTNLLAGGGTIDTLKYTVTKTGSSIGQVTIRARVHLRDVGTGNPLPPDETFAGIAVQEPANLKIINLVPSQNSVTRNQGQDWNIKVVLLNEGGTDIKIDTLSAKTSLNFSLGNNFKLKRPTALSSGGLNLNAGSVDTLTFIVDGTILTTGNCLISARVTGIQTTSGDTTVATFQRTTPVVIENPAKIKILSVINRAPNPPFVNKGQVFPVHVTLENNGQDEIREAIVKMTSSGGSIAGALSLTFNDILGNGGKKEQIFSIKADSLTTVTDNFTVKIDKVEAQNTKEPAGVIRELAADSTETAIIQTAATFQVANIVVPGAIRASQVESWKIAVVVHNAGQASLVVQTPTSADIKIRVNTVDYKDYIITPPAALQSGGLILTGGRTDTLIYVVTTTPSNAGSASIEVVLQGNDRNSQKLLIAPGYKAFTIQSSSAVQLFKTEPVLCTNFDGEKALVNRGQPFAVRVTVQNLGRKKVKDVLLKLITSGASIIAQNQQTIPSIEHNETMFADFQIMADPNAVNPNEVFLSEILSALEFDTNLPAAIDNTGDNRARIAIYDSAKLVINAWTSTGDSVYTVNQKFTVKANVQNLGGSPAPVDDGGILRLYAPDNYRIVVGTDTIPGSRSLPFQPGQEVEWGVLTPEFASGPDTILVTIENEPKDKNIDRKALVVERSKQVVVRTLASNIIFATSIASPSGAMDRVVSTLQEFTVQSVIQFSENLKNVQATLTLPSRSPRYKFVSAGDSTQNVSQSLRPINWRLNAPDLADNDFRTIRIKITALEKGKQLTFSDSIKVKTVSRANLEILRTISYPEAASKGTLSVGRPFGIRAEVKNLGIAGAIETGQLEINLGSTGCIFADTSEKNIKGFEVDSAITWKLVAPQNPTPEAALRIRFIKLPNDENTGDPAHVDESKQTTDLLVRTVQGGTIATNASIQFPEGAKDLILSSTQTFTISAGVTSSSVKDVTAELIIPGSFSYGINENSRKKVDAGQSSVQWSVRAPSDSASKNVLKVVCFGKDNNDETMTITSDTARINLKVIRSAQVEVIAEIISPQEATDNKVSLTQQFVVQARLANYGQAGFKPGIYNLELFLPFGQDYSTSDPMKKSLTGLESVQWLIKAPAHPTSLGNIEVRVPQNEGPRDENSDQEVNFWQGIRRDIIPIETIQKTVIIAALENRTPNNVAKGQSQVSMLGITILNQKEDVFSNNIVLNGLRLTITDRERKPIENPAQVISRVAITNYRNPAIVYGSVTNFNTGGIIPINLSRPDTIRAGEADSLDLVIDIAPEPAITSVMFSLAVDTNNVFIQEAKTPYKPVLRGALDETNFTLESDFCLIKGDNLKDYFCNYPNPFGSHERPTTAIPYYLKEDADVEIKIYTLIGELVWSRSYKANEPQGRKGPHDGDVIWDARNNQGDRILNGVYIIYIKTGAGENAMTKAAVIK